ncbi:hypothetical protein [Pyrobaculum ferrireducens]|uniref:Uncharacterized protein n=1 Tax=Pyrobaculum ferrireducens TaxID=1104324 RepID=G7VEI7_9CREN|nr:hypothetical protein [Pyrobaculum ferrireducens]AET31611.1 hypothetical protein P186_0148 [Pyrobaculum ferrireducens]
MDLGLLWRRWLGVGRFGLRSYVGVCGVGLVEGSAAAVVGRAGGGFVAYVCADVDRSFWERHGLAWGEPAQFWGGRWPAGVDYGGRCSLFSASPVYLLDRVVMRLEGPYGGFFKPLCAAPLAGSRWWVYVAGCSDVFELVGLNYPRDVCDAVFILAEGGISTYCKECGFDPNIHSSCKFSLAKAAVYHSPVGPPVAAPGRGALLGAELPVVRRRDGYLRVGSWLAWHRVLGTLDGGRWVLIGDDGLYEAVFTATVERPLEVFGEVGYVRVAGPYRGDVDDVQSPCGAPRLVACVEDTREALAAAGHRCEAEGGVPHVVLGDAVEVELGRELIDWPLSDSCGAVLKRGLYGVLTPLDVGV